MTDKLKWGIMGTGAIANAFAQGLSQSKTGVLTAIGSRGTESAEAFGAKYDVKNRHASYDARSSASLR